MSSPSELQELSVDEIRLRGTQLVEAGAGTGKTHAIASLYLRLLLEREIAVSEILVVTYTVAATAELRRRIRARIVELTARLMPSLSQDLQEQRVASEADWIRRRVAAGQAGPDRDRLLSATRSFDRAAIFTIHGFCQRVLHEHAFESGSSFERELHSDADPMIMEVAQDFWAREFYGAPRLRVLFVVDQGWLPTRFAELAAQVSSRPDAQILPSRPRQVGSVEVPEVDEVEACERHWRAILPKVAEAWQRDRDEVLGQLLEALARKEINGTSYRAKAIRERWRPAMDEALRGGEPGIVRRFTDFPKLGSSFLSDKTNKDKTTPAHPFFALCNELIEADQKLDCALGHWLAGLRHDFVAHAKKELDRRKREGDVLFFDDLLQQLGEVLEGVAGEELAASVRRRYPVALIDEFQDTDPIQYEIFRRVWHDPEDETRALFLVGDPKQAIYGFRGADVFAYLRAKQDAGDAVFGLSLNWRSDPALVEALNALFASSESPFLVDGISYAPARVSEVARDQLVGERIQSGLRILVAPRDEPEGEIPKTWPEGPGLLAGEIKRLLDTDQQIDGRPLVPGDIAVLTRTNRQVRDVQTALRAEGIPSVLQSEESVFATDEAAELERVMRAIADPDDPSRIRAALATTLLSVSAVDCLGMAADTAESTAESTAENAAESANGDSAAAWNEWTTDLRASRSLWADRGFVQALRLLWTGRGIGVRLLSRPDGERRVTNLQHLAELLHRAAGESGFGPLALLYWFGRRRAEAEGSGRWVGEDAQLRLESDAMAVQLVTVHRSKGLEYPVTVCPFLWDGALLRRGDRFRRFHDPGSGSLVLDVAPVKGGDSELAARREAFEENLRLLYVALTRSKHHCSVVWGPFAGVGASALAHLLSPSSDGAEAEYKAKSEGRLKGRDDAVQHAEIELLLQSAPGALSLDVLEPSIEARDFALPSAAAVAAATPLVSSVATRRFAGGARVSSFSGLVAAAPGDVGALRRADPAEVEGYDYDAGTRVAAELRSSEATALRVRLADFPAGALPGILLHEIFEQLDFQDSAGDTLEGLVRERLQAHGFATHWTDVVAASVRDVLAVALDPDQPASSLGGLARADRIDEMSFLLPVGRDGGLTARALADVFARHATNSLVTRYAERAGSLGFSTLEGHLRGFVDLVFRRGDRFAVVDYKSNWLGPAATDYEPDALERSMLEHDYVLQYHLYLVALHRHLGQRLPDYDYDRHVSGAYYLFLRGISPESPPGRGILHDRPPRALIDALSELLS